MPDVIVHNWCSNGQIGVQVPIGDWCKRHGKTFKYLVGCGQMQHRKMLYQQIPKARHVFMWGGHQPSCGIVRDLCHEYGVKCWTCELGWLPQKNNFSIDPKGILGWSSLCEPLDWVTLEMMKEAEEFRDEWLRVATGGIEWSGGGGYILIPLQIEVDASIVFHSKWKRMQKFVRHVEETYPDNQVVVRPHPLRKWRTILTRGLVWRGGSLFSLIAKADKVVGINSTSLVEAVMMGAPVVACGRGPLYHHEGEDRWKLMAAYVSRQFSRQGRGIDKVFERLGIE